MKTKTGLFIILMCVVQILNAQQFALIKDKDGFTNIRSKDNRIIDRIVSGTIVYSYDWREDKDREYIEYSRSGAEEGGYIYRSRLKLISQFESIPGVNETSNEITFAKDDLRISLKTGKCDLSKRVLTYNYQESNILLIDYERFWGTDGNTPQTEYKEINVSINNQQVIIPPSAYADLFSPNLQTTEVYYNRQEDELYILSLNGDGAGGYRILWRVKKGIYTDRLVARGF